MLNLRVSRGSALPIKIVFALAFCGVLSAAVGGCGGGSGGNSSRTVLPKISVSWPGRSRQLPAPQSALSLSVTLKNARPDGSDLVMCFDRDSNGAAHIQNYTAQQGGVPGPHHFLVAFFADPACGGSVVATAEGDMTLNADGTGVPDVAYASLVATVTVNSGQSVDVGQTKSLLFTARDANGAVVAVSPGSVNWAVVTGQTFLQFISAQANGLSAGTATVTATIDGHASPAQSVAVVVPNTSYNFVDVHADLASQFSATNSEALGINSNGDIVGYFVTGDNLSHAFLRTANGTYTNLGLGIARGVNASDLVVGDGSQNVAMLWQSNGTATPLPALAGDVQSQAYGINDLNRVVGTSLNGFGDDTYTPVWWTASPGTASSPQKLPTPASPGGYGFGYAVNNSNQIVGGNFTGFQGPRYPIFWDLSSVGYHFKPWSQLTRAEALAVNASGTSAGYMFLNGLTRAARIMSDGTIVELQHQAGEFSKANGINTAGDIVGQRQSHPSLWTVGGSTVDLDTAAAMPVSPGNNRANAINDLGWTAGARFFNNKFQAFLLIPR